MTARKLVSSLLGLGLGITSIAVVATADSPATASNPPPSVLESQQVGELVEADSTLTYQSETQTISHPGATYIKVRFAGLDLAPGDYLTVSSPDGQEVHTYHGSPDNGWRHTDSDYTLHEDTGFAAMSIEGDTAILTIHSDNAAVTAEGVEIDGYWRGYDQAEYEAANPGLQAVCGPDGRKDSVCYQSSHPTEYSRSGAVARLLMGGSACTAWRVGDSNRMFTNNHCMSTDAAVAGSESQFDYECATCGGNDPKTPTKVSGATMFATSSQLDYTLYSVNSFDTITSFGTLYIESREPVLNERIYIPGHGAAEPKRLSITEEDGGADCKIDQVVYSTINTGYNCDTEGGSSGSPVLAGDSHTVIALHRIGSCLNGGTRMALIYPEVIDLIEQ